jgi:hypothetical protein
MEAPIRFKSHFAHELVLEVMARKTGADRSQGVSVVTPALLPAIF